MDGSKKRYFTYILLCADNTYYTGKTSDLTKRVRQHNGEVGGGAKYTRTRRPVSLVYFEEWETNKLACAIESQIKHLSRIKKEERIKKHSLKI